jgi:3-oxoacyl-[acyl-carrier protein] reductase
MDMLLRGKRALITGSTSGIGAQCARVLAGEGVSVVINGRNADRAAAVTQERKVGGEAKFVLGDVTTEDGSNAVIEGVKSAFDGIEGPKKICHDDFDSYVLV